MKLKRQHKVILRVTFDKPVAAAYAVREVADCIYGDFYPTDYGRPGHNAEQFIVRGASQTGVGDRR